MSWAHRGYTDLSEAPEDNKGRAWCRTQPFDPFTGPTDSHSPTVTRAGRCGQNPGRVMSLREERKRQTQLCAALATVRSTCRNLREGPAPREDLWGGGENEQEGLIPDGIGEQDCEKGPLRAPSRPDPPQTMLSSVASSQASLPPVSSPSPCCCQRDFSKIKIRSHHSPINPAAVPHCPPVRATLQGLQDSDSIT